MPFTSYYYYFLISLHSFFLCTYDLFIYFREGVHAPVAGVRTVGGERSREREGENLKQECTVSVEPDVAIDVMILTS